MPAKRNTTTNKKKSTAQTRKEKNEKRRKPRANAQEKRKHNRRTDFERERDRILIGDLYLKGKTTREIAQELNSRKGVTYTLTHTTVNNDLHITQGLWRKRAQSQYDEEVAKLLAGYDLQLRELWEALEESKKPEVVTRYYLKGKAKRKAVNSDDKDLVEEYETLEKDGKVVPVLRTERTRVASVPILTLIKSVMKDKAALIAANRMLSGGNGGGGLPNDTPQIGGEGEYVPPTPEFIDNASLETIEKIVHGDLNLINFDNVDTEDAEIVE